MTRNRLGIIPNLHFYCNARITAIKVRILSDDTKNDFLYLQVWRPTTQGSKIYNKIAQVQVSTNDIIQSTYLEANIELIGTKRIVVQSGDVIGYYQPPESRYVVRSIQTPGYALYSFTIDASSVPGPSVNLNKAKLRTGLRQPLIHFTVGKYNMSQCTLFMVHRCLDNEVPRCAKLSHDLVI